jgi:hypothetical protein
MDFKDHKIFNHLKNFVSPSDINSHTLKTLNHFSRFLRGIQKN